MTGSQAAMLRNLCNVFRIPVEACQSAPEVALQCLILLYSMPLIRDRARRRAYGNEILGATRGHFDPYSQFVGALGQNVIMMQEFPHYFRNLNMSTDDLVAKYRALSNLNYYIRALGMIGGPSALGAAIGEGIRSGVGAGAQRFAGRMAGHGPITEALRSRMGPGTARAGGAAIIVVVAGAAVAYHSGEEQMRDIRAIIQHRFQNGGATQEQYRAVMGDVIDPSAIRRYWEYR